MTRELWSIQAKFTNTSFSLGKQVQQRFGSKSNHGKIAASGAKSQPCQGSSESEA